MAKAIPPGPAAAREGEAGTIQAQQVLGEMEVKENEAEITSTAGATSMWRSSMIVSSGAGLSRTTARLWSSITSGMWIKKTRESRLN